MTWFIGHVLPGGFITILGFWQLYNTILQYTASPWDFEAKLWYEYRNPKYKYMELICLMIGSCISIFAELVLSMPGMRTLDSDFTISGDHLNNFEHAAVYLFFLIYASSALYAELKRVRLPPGLLHVVWAAGFGAEVLIMHFHSSVHSGVEGQYHMLLQVIVGVTFVSLLAGAAFPRSFSAAAVRSLSIMMQGVWLVQIAFSLWVPSLIPKGCHSETLRGHDMVICPNKTDEMRAVALANLQLCWYSAGSVVLMLVLYFVHSGVSDGGYYRKIEETKELVSVPMRDLESTQDVYEDVNGSRGMPDLKFES